MIVVGDVAGQLKTLKKLLEPFIGKERIILAGDMVDRGLDSRGVIDFAINNNLEAVYGNHEDFMVDWYLSQVSDIHHVRKYEDGLWFDNGGEQTYYSYSKSGSHANVLSNMKDHIAWLRKLPIKIETEKLIITHAPLNKLEDSYGQYWNRAKPTEITNKIQIFGHNSFWGLKEFKNEKNELWAICIDTSGEEKLTALQIDENTLEYKVHKQEYICS